MLVSYTDIKTPIGRLLLAATERGLCALLFADNLKQSLENLRKQYPKAQLSPATGKQAEMLAHWGDAITDYINGKQKLPKLPLDIKGTDFQRKIWDQLLKIPFGKLMSYKQVAEAAGMPKAARAVANACANNNIVLIIPCHRVIHNDGSISGYGGGVERKRVLIELEKRFG